MAAPGGANATGIGIAGRFVARLAGDLPQDVPELAAMHGFIPQDVSELLVRALGAQGGAGSDVGERAEDEPLTAPAARSMTGQSTWSSIVW